MIDLERKRIEKKIAKEKIIDDANREVEAATRQFEMKQKNGVAKPEDVTKWFRAVGMAHQKRDNAK